MAVPSSNFAFLAQHDPLLVRLPTFLARQAWTTPQRGWISRIAKQLKLETVVDRDALDQGAFKSAGGFTRIDKVFDGKLAAVLGDLQDALWSEAG